MTVLRYAGAAYLIWMGIKMWTSEPVVPQADHARTSAISGKGFVTGVVLNLGNPKMPLFYLALLPNVVSAILTVGQAVQLALVILLVEVIVIGGHVALAARARRALTSPTVVRRVNRGAGAVMVGAGVAVAATR